MNYKALSQHKQKLITHWLTSGVVTDERFITAFMAVPRERFILNDLEQQAYVDVPLPTLREQSLSQPSTIMLMLQAAEVHEGDRVLEVGAGVGYQACLLGHLVGPHGKVITTEIIPELVTLAKQHVQEEHLSTVTVLEQDGGVGVEEEAPFDKILITAAAPQIPPPLIKQLKEGGIIIAPIGDKEQQHMIKAVKRKGILDIEILGAFVFVPLRGKYGFEEELF